MNVIVKMCCRQVPVFVLLLITASCGIRKTDTPVLPPVTSPLSRSVIGYGVINVSYTQLKVEPSADGASHGYVRRGAVVRVLERRLVHAGNAIEGWVLTEGDYQGWLREDAIDIYDNELQAQTAAESMTQ